MLSFYFLIISYTRIYVRPYLCLGQLQNYVFRLVYAGQSHGFCLYCTQNPDFIIILFLLYSPKVVKSLVS